MSGPTSVGFAKVHSTEKTHYAGKFSKYVLLERWVSLIGTDTWKMGVKLASILRVSRQRENPRNPHLFVQSLPHSTLVVHQVQPKARQWEMDTANAINTPLYESEYLNVSSVPLLVTVTSHFKRYGMHEKRMHRYTY